MRVHCVCVAYLDSVFAIFPQKIRFLVNIDMCEYLQEWMILKCIFRFRFAHYPFLAATCTLRPAHRRGLSESTSSPPPGKLAPDYLFYAPNDLTNFPLAVKIHTGV